MTRHLSTKGYICNIYQQKNTEDRGEFRSSGLRVGWEWGQFTHTGEIHHDTCVSLWETGKL